MWAVTSIQDRHFRGSLLRSVFLLQRNKTWCSGVFCSAVATGKTKNKGFISIKIPSAVIQDRKP